MIPAGHRFQVLVATRPVGLAAVVQQQLRLDPFCGAVFVFRAKRADRVKLLVWDGSGLTLIYKRLDEAKFVWPRIEDGVMRLSPGQVGALFEGLDWKRVHSRRVPRPNPLPEPAEATPLPDDVAALKALLLAERAMAAKLAGQNEHLRAIVEHRARPLRSAMPALLDSRARGTTPWFAP